MKDLKHYGTPRRSGRYPWGSGNDSYQRGGSFLGYVNDLKKQGLSDVEIARGLGITTTQLRERRSIARAEKRAADAALAIRLYDKGYSKVAIGKRMGINESSVRSLLDPAIKERASITATTSLVLKDNVDRKGLIDVGVGVETHLGISRTKLNTAIAMLEEEGYTVHYIREKQPGTGKYTSIKVLAPPGTTYSEVFKNRDKMGMVMEYSEDGGRSFLGLEPISNVNSKRILVKYNDDGGSLKDGVIEIRPGTEDLYLGNARYAQARIGVDGTHFMKGMVMYNNNLPDGVDIIYNTKKDRGATKDEIFKQMKDDPDNPFGAVVKQKHYIDADGNERVSAINIVNEEGDWSTWSKTLSSQILSKQNPALAKKQLGLAFDLKKEEFDEIMSLTNPSVKKRLLETFADEADAAAVNLKAAALPRQASQVILPITSLKENEIYAPNFRNGERVVLIRHPHGGVFEIPEVTVNNKNPEANSIIKKAKDAIGINPKIAGRLSGADFDGDTVLVIPNKNKEIRTSSPLKGLADFDPTVSYPEVKGMKYITKYNKQKEMGNISNLITDMTIKAASESEIARAVRHSMVVIDAEKHKLNYKQSFDDNNIAELKKKYQGSEKSGAATLISKASAVIFKRERREGQYITDPKTGKKKKVYVDPETGDKLYEETGRVYPERKRVKDPISGKISYVETGKMIPAKTKTTRMAEEKDAFNLSSGTAVETVYAKHANALKDLARTARKVALSTKAIPYSPSARQTFKKEVEVLKAKLANAFRNKPFERKATLLANKIVASKKKANPDLDEKELKKIKGQALEEARRRVGAKKESIVITDREWLAIQAGAISPNTLSKILLNTDVKALKEKALPRYKASVSPAKSARMKSMHASGYTTSEIADSLGLSNSQVESVIYDEG